MFFVVVVLIGGWLLFYIEGDKEHVQTVSIYRMQCKRKVLKTKY